MRARGIRVAAGLVDPVLLAWHEKRRHAPTQEDRARAAVALALFASPALHGLRRWTVT